MAYKKQNEILKKKRIELSLIIALVFVLGFAFSQMFFIKTEIKKEFINMNNTCPKRLDGLYTRNLCDFAGDWVHVEITDMKYERAVEVIKHEVFHEIFAECGERKNPRECFEEYLNYTEKTK